MTTIDVSSIYGQYQDILSGRTEPTPAQQTLASAYNIGQKIETLRKQVPIFENLYRRGLIPKSHVDSLKAAIAKLEGVVENRVEAARFQETPVEISAYDFGMLKSQLKELQTKTAERETSYSQPAVQGDVPATIASPSIADFWNNPTMQWIGIGVAAVLIGFLVFGVKK